MWHHEDKELLKKIDREVTELKQEVKELLRLLRKPVKGFIVFIDKEGRIIKMDISFVLSPTASTVAVFIQKNADGSVFQSDPANLQWSVEDNTVVSLSQNADGTATIKPLAAGTSRIGVVDSVTKINAVAVVTVTAPQTGPASGEIQFTNVTA